MFWETWVQSIMVISGFLLLFPAVNINISKYLSFFFLLLINSF